MSYMSRWIVFFCLIISSVSSYSQIIGTPEYYDYYKDIDKDSIYYEYFSGINDINKEWLEEDSVVFKKSIHDGVLDLYNHDEHGRTYAASFDVDINFKRNFEIEISAKILKTRSGLKSGVLFWGCDSSKDNYNGEIFNFYHDHFHTLFYSACGCDTGDNVFGLRVLKNNREYNTYTFRKIGDTYNVFINKEFAGTYLYFPLTFPTLGLGASSETEVLYDYIKISYLNTPKKNWSKPLYITGESAFNRYIWNQLSEMNNYRGACTNGTFLVRFNVDESGHVYDITSNSGNDSLNHNLIKIIKSTDKTWIPAYRNDTPYKAKVDKVVQIASTDKIMCPTSDYYFEKGMKYYNQNNIDKALENFKIAAGKDFANIKALYNTAIIYINNVDYANACIYLNRINDLRDVKAIDRVMINQQISNTDTDILLKQYCNH